MGDVNIPSIAISHTSLFADFEGFFYCFLSKCFEDWGFKVCMAFFGVLPMTFTDVNPRCSLNDDLVCKIISVSQPDRESVTVV